jgi:hypothetical protein
MRLTAAFVLTAVLASAAVDGTVRNLTSDSGQANAIVTLVELGSGMNTLGSVRTDASGNFTFAADLKPGTPYLIQALHQGVTYNQMLQPGAQSSGIRLEVYDASPKAPDARVTQHMILLEPSAGELLVNEAVIFTNTGKVTYQDPDGTLKVWVPTAVKTPVRLRITAPQGMPISREAEKSRQSNVYLVRYPIKPGETRIDLQYGLPASEKFESRILHGGGPVRIIAPKGVKLESPALADLGPEPRTQATVYELKGRQYALNIVGTGTLRDNSAEAASASASESTAEQDSPGIDAVRPRLYERLAPVLGLVFAMLAIGFVLLYRTAA